MLQRNYTLQRRGLGTAALDHDQQNDAAINRRPGRSRRTGRTARDAPGAYSGDVIEALAAVDAAILVVDASAASGPAPRRCGGWPRRGSAALIFINKMDRGERQLMRARRLKKRPKIALLPPVSGSAGVAAPHRRDRRTPDCEGGKPSRSRSPEMRAARNHRRPRQAAAEAATVMTTSTVSRSATETRRRPRGDARGKRVPSSGSAPAEHRRPRR